ncbi:MAG: hypothetical protein ACRCYY_14655 [Trueperaceae bacterium]
MLVHSDNLELGFTYPSSPRLEKLVTTLINAEQHNKHDLSARLAHHLGQQLEQRGEHQAALHWLKQSMQLYQAQTALSPDFWETLRDWLSIVLAEKSGEVIELLETLLPCQTHQTPKEDTFLEHHFLVTSSLVDTHRDDRPTDEVFNPKVPLELRFFGKAGWRGNDSLPTLRPRFAELLTVLALHPEGLTNEQLTLAVYGENTDITCCKTEVNRLKHLIPVLSRPYRLDMPVWADFLELPKLLKAGRIGEAIALYEGPLLPNSEAPEVCHVRRSLEESLCTVTIESGTGEDLWRLGSRIHDDLELWEAIQARLPQGDPRRGMAKAHVSSLRRSWGIH